MPVISTQTWLAHWKQFINPDDDGFHSDCLAFLSPVDRIKRTNSVAVSFRRMERMECRYRTRYCPESNRADDIDTSTRVSIDSVIDTDPDSLSLCLIAYDVLVPEEINDVVNKTSIP